MSPPDDPPSSVDGPPDDGRRAGPRERRTWPERLAIIGTLASALLCFVVAAALVVGYLVVRQRNIVDLEERAEATADTSAVVPQTDPPVATAEPTTTATTPVAVTETSGTEASGTLSSDGTVSSDGTESSDETTGGDATAPPETVAPDDSGADTEPASTTEVTTTTTAQNEAPTVTFPDADPEALNFLVTGADNNACIDEDSPYYGTFGDREGMGERSDTIMVLRVDPGSNRVAILSFPRDLYVEISDGGGMSRINSAYERNEPQRLVDTIFDNFGVAIDHYIQVDFCAFKTLVDSVGGVAVPFEFPARDDNTGLNVPSAGCFTFDGEHALAYVRSRHYEYEDPPGSGNWQTDPTSDLGRISRQQDFLRRTLASLLDTGPLNPRVARGLIRATTTYITTDRDLTPARMMEFAGVMNDVDPGSILTYQIEATGRTIGGAAVLVPNTDSQNMQAVLAIFRGETSLADAVDQVFEPTTAAASRDSTTTVAESTVPGSEPEAGPLDEGDTGATTEASESTAAESTIVESTLPQGAPAQNEFGIVPPRDQTC